jgi:hypothetical protein
MQKSLAEVTSEDLEEITRLAGLFIIPRDIAMMLEINISEFIEASETIDTPVYQAFYSGRLQGEVDLRESIQKMATAGSVPAQQMMLDFHKQSKMKMIDR